MTQETNEISLDPQDWDTFSQLAHEALDSAIEHIRNASDRPIWRSLPEAARRDIEKPVPREPGDLRDILQRAKRSILPYPTGNAHPRFWGWVMGNGTAESMIADLLASAMNPHVAGYDQSASAVEQTVIHWLIELMGYPDVASGLLVSGGTVANLTGLTVARNTKADFDLRAQGLHGGPRLRVYGSVETHSWAEKCCDLLGLGRSAFCRVAADREGKVDVQVLRQAIHRDRQRGDHPFCVIGNAGTVDTGAIDDLEALGALCQEEDLWLHVDGAFGALVAFSSSLCGLLRGLENSDSVAFDLHKWGYLPYEVGCVLVRDREAHRAAFQTSAKYLKTPGRGIQPEPLEFANLGIQLSRGFRALKVWTAFQTHGVDRIGKVIEQNVKQAQFLATLIQAKDSLELLAPVPLNVVCFRYAVPGLDEDALEELNRKILIALQEGAIAIPSSTWRGERFALRVAITNHRTRRSDLDLLVKTVLDLGKRHAQSLINDPHNEP